MHDDRDQEPTTPRSDWRAARERSGRRGRIAGLVGLALLIGAIALNVALDKDDAPKPAPPTPVDEDPWAHIEPLNPKRKPIQGGRSARLAHLAGKRADFVMENGVLSWTGAQRSYEIAEVQRRGSLVLRAEAGAVKVLPEVYERHTEGPPAALVAILDRAQVDDRSLTGATVHDDGFWPLHVKGGGFLLVEGGPMVRDATAAAALRTKRGETMAALHRATATFLASLDDAPLDESTRKALTQVIGAIPRKNGNFWSSLSPEITRRLVRHGWLKQVGANAQATAALESAVLAAVARQPYQMLTGDGGTWSKTKDSFGRELEILETADGTWFTVPQPRPQWLGRAAPRKVSVKLAAGADPFADTLEPLAAEVAPFDGRWKKGGVLTVDADGWRRAMKRTIGSEPHQPYDVFPPHILVTNGYGDAQLLITQHGTVRPARSANPAERTRFFDEAAKALPDVAHMDLVGEILYTYAWDTAEYDRPLLIGTEDFNGDIHQTADQTLETGRSGIYRGDCDDLACFYHALTLHQGRNAHVLSLPHHLANAYAEQQEDGSWMVAILHTGPPLHVRGRTLEEAIERTMESFESHESVDLGGLPFSLRFGGDAVRQRYMLPVDIFRDAKYAQDLIEVQAAYRFHTYRTGIETMERILKARPKVTAADHRETAHLMTWADRHLDATPHFEKAVTAATTPASRVDAALDLLGNLVASGQDERARTVQKDLATKYIPAFEKEVGHYLMQPWIRMANALLEEDEHKTLGLAVLAGPASARVRTAYKAIEDVARRKGFSPRWLHYNGLPRFTSNVGDYVFAALTAMTETRGSMDAAALEHRAVLDEMLQRWFQNIAFRTLHDNASVLGLYGSVASYYEGHIGEANLERLVEKAGPPTAADLRRSRTPLPITSTPASFHLRMIHMAPSYHRARWWRGLVAKPDKHDPAATRRAMAAQLAAIDAADRQGLGHHDDPNEILLARLARAVLAGDAKAAKPLLVQAESRRDYSLEIDVVRLLAASAHRHEVARWIPLARVWADTMGRTPDYLNLAWYAMRDDHPGHAVAMGRLAVERHPERQDFARELEHLMQVAQRK